MTREEYDRLVATGELQLNGFWANATHFSLPIACLILVVAFPAVHLYLFLQGGPSSFNIVELLVALVVTMLGFLFFRLQKSRLKFKVIQTTLTRAQIVAIIERVGVELEWKGAFITNDIYKAKTNPGFFSGSWGEEITILLPGNRLFVNSICDPDQKTSMVSAGRNRENEDTLIESIKRAEQLVAQGIH